MELFKKRVAYYYDDSIGDFYYGAGHPMKPNRVRMTDNLVNVYGLYNKMEVIKPPYLSSNKMKKFHDGDYINFLENISISDDKENEKASLDFLGKSEHSDCPMFEGLFEFCQLYSGGSVGGASKLNHKESDVVINWAGGFHHAKKLEAAGFCYINDIVLAIIELLKCHSRVMYIDIDVHHGDGVEEAFYDTNRVLTLSFHKGGDFYPGTGKIENIGHEKGTFYSVNFPLEEGIDDENFFSIFVPVMDALFERFRPEAIVFQSGADSIAGDRLGSFNLTCLGHGKCVKHVLDKNIPTLLLGGGGYTVRNVSRCWAYETAVCLGSDLSNDLPFNDFYDYYAPDFQLHIPPIMIKNRNSRRYLEETKSKILENARSIEIAPSVQMKESESLESSELNDENKE